MTVYVVLTGQDYRSSAVFGVYLDKRTARSEIERYCETYKGPKPMVETSEGYWNSGNDSIELEEHEVRT